jgi:Icc-related predicted phosphoesterase
MRKAAEGRERELRSLFGQKIEEAHEAFCSGVPGNVVLTYGNVDNPELIRKYLSDGPRFVDAEVLEFGGARFGFVGGGLPKIGIAGEVSLEDYQRKVDVLGPVDVLCAHVPPAHEDLTFDVAAEFHEPGSEALLGYIEAYRPTHVYFGHVHQPRETRMTMGESLLVNVGHHYRATGKALEHPA